jgi:hypothetical protein
VLALPGIGWLEEKVLETDSSVDNLPEMAGRRKAEKMGDTDSHRRNYVFASFLGAIGGGLFVALATTAIPKMVSQMMSEMMQNMMSRMVEAGCDPEEM